MSGLSKRIKKFRKDMGVSQTVLAFSLGVNQGHISKIERGEANPSEQLIKLICKTYEINEEWLREGRGSRSPRLPLKTEELRSLALGFKEDEYRALKRYLKLLFGQLENYVKYLSKVKKPKKERDAFSKTLDRINIPKGKLIEIEEDLGINELKNDLLIKIEELRQIIFPHSEVEKSVIRILREINDDSLKDFYLLLAAKAKRLNEEARSDLKKDISLLKKAAK